VIPDYDTVIFDEAHLIEEVATQYFGLQVSSNRIEEIARDAERLAASFRGPAKGGGGAAALRIAAQEFFLPIRERLRGEAGRVRFDAPQHGGLALEDPWQALRAALAELGRQAAILGGENGEGLVRRSEESIDAVSRILGRSDPGFVYGIEAQGRGVLLSAAPIDVSDLLRETLFDRLHACVLTSATLTVDGSFEFYRSRLGLTECETRVVATSFDHESQAVLYLPPSMPEPRDPEFVGAAVRQIEALLEVTGGRAFLLFTSYANLARVSECLAARGEYPLFVQGEGSRHVLLDRFRSSRNGVLLGTSSFWHGVDVAGEALSLVVIDKLPFDVPGDPLVAARIARIRQDGGDPFREYQTPLAVLELKQGLGRLLRSRTDRGILAVLDPRLTTRGYGKTFLRSLPPYRIVRDVAACRRFFVPPAEAPAG
jgi:ATP-dependent DNA helicase DinG